MVNNYNTEVKSEIEEYERFARFYRQIGNKRGHFDLQAAYLRPVIETYNPDKLLDASCGTGDVLNRLSDYFPQIQLFGSDGCTDLLKKTNNLSNVRNISFSHCHWSDLVIKYPRCNFNLIYILGNSIAHVSSIEEFYLVLCNIYQILSKNGVFLFDLRSWDNIANNISFNEPLCNTNKITIDDNFEYITSYTYDVNRHILIHDIRQIKSSASIEKIELSFMDFSNYNLKEIIHSAGFNILNSHNFGKEYHFDTYYLIKL